MPNLNDVIALGILGDHFDITREVTGVPEGNVVSEAWLTVKEILDSDPTDTTVVFQKHITTTPTAAGQITDPGSGSGEARRAEFLFHLLPTDTFSWVDGATKKWDIQLKLDSGGINTPYLGTMSGKQGVTNRTEQP